MKEANVHKLVFMIMFVDKIILTVKATRSAYATFEGIVSFTSIPQRNMPP